MPPFVPDNDDDDDSDVSDGVDEIMPPKKQQKAKSKTPVKKPQKPADPVDESDDQDAAEGDQDDDSEEEEEFQVEKIISHAFDAQGTVKYEVKWVGYEAKKDRTWEPVGNLSGAPDMLNDYHKNIGGPPTKPQTPAKKGRKRNLQPPAATPDVDESARSKKRKTNGTTSSATKSAALDYKLPIGSWEDDVESIDTIAEKLVAGKSRNAKPTKELYVLAVWNNGARFEHSVETVRQKCPQKLLDYLLSKVIFKTTDSDIYTKADEADAPLDQETDVSMPDE